MFFVILPVLLINPLAGVYVDRWNKRITMFASDFLRGVIILALALFFLKFKTLIPVYIIIFLASSAGRFFIPAKMALMPRLVEGKDIYMANSLTSITANVAAIFGLGFGGIIVEKWGPRGGFLIDAFTFFASSLLVLSIRHREKVHKIKIKKEIIALGKDIARQEKSLFYEFKEGIKYILSSRDTVFSIKTFFILFSFLGSLYAVFIAFVQASLHTATKDLGFLAIWLGLGLFLGSLAYGRIAHKFSPTRSINFMLVVEALLLAGFAFMLKARPSGFYSCIFSFLLGAFASPILIGANSLIHNASNKNFWGRIFSSMEVVMHFSFLVFMFIASFLADRIGYFTVIISAAIILFVFAVVSLIIRDDKSRTL